MTTLSDIMYGAWTDLGHVSLIQCTGGSTTTIVDTNTRYTTTDALKNGTAVVVDTTNHLTPKGQFSRLKAFDAGTKTFTINALTDAVEAFDTIALCRPTIPLLHMKAAVNAALKDHIGTLSKVDVTLTSSSGNATYTLPSGVGIKRLIDVQIEPGGNGQASIGEAYHSIISQIEILPSTNGWEMISHNLPAGKIIKVIYEGTHADLTAYSDTVHESIPEALLKIATIEKALTWLVSKKDNSALGTFIIQKLNDARQTVENMKITHPVNRLPTKARWFV